MVTAVAVAGLTGASYAHFSGGEGRASAVDLRSRHYSESFQRVATLGNYLGLGASRLGDTTVSEIVAATKDGKTLVYTDSPGKRIGLVDITDPRKPRHVGEVALTGEPTSVDVLGNDLALVAVNTSQSYTQTSGELVVVDISIPGSPSIARSLPLGGQPDSIKISSDGHYAAIAIENERDEGIEVNDVEGGLPQLPAGFLVVVDILGAPPADWQTHQVSLSGLADYAPDDPEPEFVDINEANEAVVSLQENNHLVVVDLATRQVLDDFPAGTVSLTGIDAVEDDLISLTDSLPDVPREPDAVTWMRGGKRAEPLIATANEGDLFGGSRGFTLFDRSGNPVFDSGAALEEIAVQHGHYPEGRSENKGSEPEAIEYARFGREDYLFVGSERGSFVAVYQMQGMRPRFSQLLAAPLGPEGLLAIPSRGLLIAAGEEDDPEYGVRSSLMIYQLQRGRPDYPQILSADRHGSPIPWSALSGMVADPHREHRLFAVWDGFFSESRVLSIDVSKQPAVIIGAMTLSGGTGGYDPEGIAIAPDGSLWIASEGNASDSKPNRLLQVDARTGAVLQEIGLPQEILDCRKASTKRGTLGSGFEGLAVQRVRKGYRLLVAQQRGWDYTTADCEDLDDDAGGLDANGESRQTRVWTYDPAEQTWDHISWELAEVPEQASWVGLSEITAAPDGAFLVIERDNRTGDFAEIKDLTRVSARALADGRVEAAEKSAVDLIPSLEATKGWITDKPEGVAVTRTGEVYVVTDNDGVDEWSGETWLLDLGRYWRLFR